MHKTARQAELTDSPKGLSVEYIAASSLIQSERNARTHSQEQIKQLTRSILEWGWTNPILIDEDRAIIAGHGRLAAAQSLGMVEVPTITLAGLSAAQKRALAIADNKLALNAGWDDDLLRLELCDLKLDGFDLSMIGFSDLELAGLLDSNPGLTDPDDAPEVQAEAVSVLGDVWLLGRHRLVCGDSSSIDAVRLALGLARPHLMVTDPPYGVNYDATWRQRAGVGSKGAAIGAVMNDDRADWRTAWALFPGNVAYVWHGGLHCAVVEESLAACRLRVRAQIVWVKTRPALSRGHYHWQHEPCLYTVREGEADEFRFAEEHELAFYVVRGGATGAWQGGRKQSTVWFIEHLRSDTGHSTQKPAECMRRPIENNSSPGQAVYDPFVGSGTTIIAAEMTGRACHAIEISPQYVDVAVRRWQLFTGQFATLDADGRTFVAVEAQRMEHANAA